jgi:hypothetical protein
VCLPSGIADRTTLRRERGLPSDRRRASKWERARNSYFLEKAIGGCREQQTAEFTRSTYTPVSAERRSYAIARRLVAENEGQKSGLFQMGKTTPYFLFVGENRADVKAALLEAGEATSLGNVGKALGLKWKALTDEQREVRVGIDTSGRGLGVSEPRLYMLISSPFTKLPPLCSPSQTQTCQKHQLSPLQLLRQADPASTSLLNHSYNSQLPISPSASLGLRHRHT